MSEEKRYWFGSSCGRIELSLTIDQAESASHQGQCDADVLALSEEPEIAKQLAAIRPSDLAKELREYGAWSDSELSDHAQNLQRILWLAAGSILDELTEGTRGEIS